MLIPRISKYPVENVLFRNAMEIFFFNLNLPKMDVEDKKSIR